MEMFSTRAPSGKSMPRKKMSLQPLCSGPCARAWPRAGWERAGRGASRCQQFGANAQRIVGRMAGAEHPLVAAHRAHAAAHLVGQGLEPKRAVAGGQRAGKRRRSGRRRPARRGRCRWLPRSGASAGWCSRRKESARCAPGVSRGRNVKAVDGVQEKQGPHALVEVVAARAGTGRAPRIRAAVLRVAAPRQKRFERAIAGLRIAGGDDVG